MAFQMSVALRNAMLDLIESTLGTTPNLIFYSGSEPVNVAASDPSGTLVTMALPSDWMSDASAGSKAKTGTWSTTASGSGTLASWRLKTSGGTTHLQGSVTATGGGGDITVDNTSIASGQTILMNTFTITAPNA